MIVNCPKCHLSYDHKIGKHYTCSCGTEFIVDESGEVLVIDTGSAPSQDRPSAGPPPPVVQSIFSGSADKSNSGRDGNNAGRKDGSSKKWFIYGSILVVLLALYWWRESVDRRIASERQKSRDFQISPDPRIPKFTTPQLPKFTTPQIPADPFSSGANHDRGEAVPNDPSNKAETLRRSAENGDAEAQFNLGVCYENGRGVPKDLEQAVYWYRKAAAQGDEDAQKALKELGY